MAFKLKQPPPGPRRRMSAREVAQDLGISVQEVVAALGNLGEFVAGPTEKVEEPVLRRLYEVLGAEYKKEIPKSPPAWDRKGTSGPRIPPRRPTPIKDKDTPSTWRTESASRRDVGDYSPTWDLASWKLFGFSEIERDTWIAEGIRSGQVREARAYSDAGLLPSDLQKVAAGWTVLKRLQAGENPTDVVRLLRRTSEDAQAG